MLKSIALVGLGGGIGSILRYLISVLFGKYVQSLFPFATFAVNIIGCFLIGLLIGLFEQNILISQNLKLLFITGFCGGFTTFSTFASENFDLFQTNNYRTAFLYLGVSIFTGLLAVWLGMKIVR